MGNLGSQSLAQRPIRTFVTPAVLSYSVSTNVISVFCRLPQIVLCIATGCKLASSSSAYSSCGEAVSHDSGQSSHGLRRPCQSLAPLPDRLRLRPEGAQLAVSDMVPLDSDAVRRNASDRISVLEIHKIEFERDARNPPCRLLDPRGIRRSLQRHDHLLARFLIGEYGRLVRRSARPNQRTFSTSERYSVLCLRYSAISDLQALGPTLIIVRAGLRGSSSSSTFTPVKGSINNSYDPPSRPNPRDIESGTRTDDGMVVHIKKATEICLNEFGLVSVVCFLLTGSLPDMYPL